MRNEMEQATYLQYLLTETLLSWIFAYLYTYTTEGNVMRVCYSVIPVNKKVP